MPDVEKVIKGLQIHADGCGWRSHHCDAMECPYRYGDECCDIEEMCRDALALLKEQGEIIQCKDCHYYHKPEYGFTIGDCTYRTAWYPVKENEFCSLAKRKEGR